MSFDTFDDAHIWYAFNGLIMQATPRKQNFHFFDGPIQIQLFRLMLKKMWEKKQYKENREEKIVSNGKEKQ